MDIIASGEAEALMNAVEFHPLVEEITAQGETKLTAHLNSGLNLDLRVVPESSFGTALQYFTGSKEHNVRLREIAVRRKWRLNEYGLYDGDTVIAGDTEQSICISRPSLTIQPRRFTLSRHSPNNQTWSACLRVEARRVR